MRSPVLVIEDYADLRLAILVTLDRGHYNGVGAATPEDAIRKLKAGNYSAIVLDPVADVRSDPVMMFLREQQPVARLPIS
jgi:DNA-binding NtrC family response regulator